MNKRKNESVANKVYSRLIEGEKDRLWSHADFRDLNAMAVAAALSRMARKGLLTRIRKGIYYKPKNTAFGSTRPTPESVTDAILKGRRAHVIPSGSSQYNRLGFTTQVSGAITRTSDRLIHVKGAGGIPLRITTRPLHFQKGIYPDERTVLDALRDLSHIPDTTPERVMIRIKDIIGSGKLKFGRLAKFGLEEPPRVRALLGALGEDLRNEGMPISSSDLERLKKSLNFLSTYRIPGLSKCMPHAVAWNIR